MFKRELRYNLKYYGWYFTLSGFIPTLPIWVAFYTSKISLGELAVVTACGSLISILLEVPTGALADLIGRRTTVFLGMMAKVMMFGLIPFISSFWGILAFMLLEGIGDALISGADVAIMYDSLKELHREDEFSQMYNNLLFRYRIGLILGSFVAGPLFMVWRGLPFVLRSVTYLISAACVYLLVEPHIDSQKFTFKTYINQTKQGIFELTRNDYVKKLAAYYIFVGGITWACLTYFNQPFIYTFNFTPRAISVITGFAYIFSSGALWLLLKKPKLLNRQNVYLGFPLLMVIGFIPALFVNKVFGIILMILIQITGSARFSILDKYVNQEFTSVNRATAISTLNMMVNLVMTSLIFLGGIIQSKFDTRLVYTSLGIVTLCIVMPLALVLIQDHKRYASHNSMVKY